MFNATGHNKSCCQFAVNKIFIMRWTFSKLQSETKAFQRTCGMNSTNNLSTCGTNCQWYMFVPILFTSVGLKSLKGWMTKRFSVISESKTYFLHLFIKIHTVKSWLYSNLTHLHVGINSTIGSVSAMLVDIHVSADSGKKKSVNMSADGQLTCPPTCWCQVSVGYQSSVGLYSPSAKCR